MQGFLLTRRILRKSGTRFSLLTWMVIALFYNAALAADTHLLIPHFNSFPEDGSYVEIVNGNDQEVMVELWAFGASGELLGKTRQRLDGQTSNRLDFREAFAFNAEQAVEGWIEVFAAEDNVLVTYHANAEEQVEALKAAESHNLAVGYLSRPLVWLTNPNRFGVDVTIMAHGADGAMLGAREFFVSESGKLGVPVAELWKADVASFEIEANGEVGVAADEDGQAPQSKVIKSGPETFMLSLNGLTISKTASALTLVRGSTGTFTLTVTNDGDIATSASLVTVTDSLPSGLTPTAASGDGWTCGIPSPSTVTCTRSDSLNGGASYPTITITASVASNALSPLTNTASVIGGGDSTAATGSVTVAVSSAPETAGVPRGFSFYPGGAQAGQTVGAAQLFGVQLMGVQTLEFHHVSVNANDPGITLVKLYQSPGQFVSRLTVAASAQPGSHKVMLRTASGLVPTSLFFVVVPQPPPVTGQMTPNQVKAGVPGGVRFFIPGAGLLSVIGIRFRFRDGIVDPSLTVSAFQKSPSHVSGMLTIPSSAVPGDRVVDLLLSDATAKPTSAFVRVIGASPPTLTISPPSVARASRNVPVSFAGTGIEPGSGLFQISGPGGVLIRDVKVLSSTLLTATFEIHPAAPTGGRGFVVRTRSGQTNVVTLTVTAATPLLSTFGPSSVGTGRMVSSGMSGTGLDSVTAVRFAPVAGGPLTAGLTFSMRGKSSSQIVGLLNADLSVSSGTYVVVLMQGAVEVRTTRTVTVTTAAPTVTSFVPTSARVGRTGFMAGGTALNAVTGVKFAFPNGGPVDSAVTGVVSFKSVTQLRGIFTVSPAATSGGRELVLVTAAGDVRTSRFVIITVSKAPSLASASPASGQRGTTVSVTLTGTNFVAGQTGVVVPSFLKITGLSVQSSTSLVVTLAVHAASPVGPTALRVGTRDGVSNPVTFSVTP